MNHKPDFDTLEYIVTYRLFQSLFMLSRDVTVILRIQKYENTSFLIQKKSENSDIQ